MADRPLIVACLRHVDQRPQVDPLTGEIERDPLAATTSLSDQAALEHALRLADTWHGRVLAVAAGPPSVEPTLREAVSAGATALRIPWPPGSRQDGHAYLDELAGDERALATAIHAGVRTVGEPVLVLCGDRSADRGTGALPAFLAGSLGCAQALGLVRLQPEGDALIAERRLDAGRRERLRVPLPAVCSVEAAGVRLRRGSLRAAVAAAEAPIPVSEPSTATAHTVHIVHAAPYRPRPKLVPAPTGTPRERLIALTGALTDRTPPTVVGPLQPSHAADTLLTYLTHHGYLTPDPREP